MPDLHRAGDVDDGTVGAHHTVAPTLADGQPCRFEFDAAGNLHVNNATLAAGERPTNKVMATEERLTSARITTATTTADIASGAGYLSHITIGKRVAAGVISVYDATTGAGTPIAVLTAPSPLLSDPPLTWWFKRQMTSGITVVTSAADDITVHYRPVVAP